MKFPENNMLVFIATCALLGSYWASSKANGQSTCEDMSCSDGRCVLLQVNCFTTPCYPIAYCVPEVGVPECDLHCPIGQRCEIVEIPNSGRSYKPECVPARTTPV